MSVEVLEFHAAWCGPCKQQRPIVDDLDEEYGDVTFSYVDIEEDTDIAREYDVQTVPTLVILHDEIEQARLTGFQQRETIEAQLTALV